MVDYKTNCSLNAKVDHKTKQRKIVDHKTKWWITKQTVHYMLRCITKKNKNSGSQNKMVDHKTKWWMTKQTAR